MASGGGGRGLVGEKNSRTVMHVLCQDQTNLQLREQTALHCSLSLTSRYLDLLLSSVAIDVGVACRL